MSDRLTWLLLAGCVMASPLRAEISMSIDILDGSDPGGSAPAGLVVVDIGVDVTNDDWFVSAGIVGDTINGAALVYAETGDPNFPVTFVPPGADNRFVSFGSAAFGRDDAVRFAPAGTVAEQTIALAGDFDGGGPVPTLLPGRISVGFFANPLATSNDPDTPRGRDGYVMRLVFDVTSVDIPGADEVSNYRIFGRGEASPGFEPVFVSDSNPWGGTVVYGWSPFARHAMNWGLYVPEPGPGGVLLLAALLRLRIRSRVRVQEEHSR